MHGARAESFSSPVCRQPAETMLRSALPVPEERAGRRGGRAASGACTSMDRQIRVTSAVRERERAAGLGGDSRERRGKALAEQRPPCQGERGRPEPPGQEEGQMAETEPAPPSAPSRCPPWEDSGRAAWLSSLRQKRGKRGSGYVLRWKLSALELQPRVISTSGMASSVFLQKTCCHVLRWLVLMGPLLSLR